LIIEFGRRSVMNAIISSVGLMC